MRRCSYLVMLAALLALPLLVAAAPGDMLQEGSGTFDLGNRAPEKPPSTYPENVRNPALQGGDTVFNATVIPGIPYSDSGTTCGFTDDYDEACPFTGSNSPEVVYKFTPPTNVSIDIDLCGSSYDTKVYVYDASLQPIACNDDYYYGPPCGNYVSFLASVSLSVGATYYIVIDGYGGACGEYQMDIAVAEQGCVIDCPEGSQYEGEQPLVENYVDHHNGGCNSPPDYRFQEIGLPSFCGVTGWYQFLGSPYRDTDWFTVEIPASGSLEIVGDAEYPTYLLQLTSGDCATVDVVQSVVMGACTPTTLTINGAPGSLAYLWVGPPDFSGPVNEYHYLVGLNLEAAPADSGCTDLTWVNPPLLSPPPAPRYAASMVVQEDASVLTLFGGRTLGSVLGDTWQWQGDRWANVAPPVSPGARFDHAMAYDRARNVVILFGGQPASGPMYGDTWEFDGTTWSQVATSGPSPRLGHVMAFDENLQQVLLFGGNDSFFLNDTWTWNGTSWSPILTETQPIGRYHAAMASDPFNKRLVLFGGLAPTGALDDTWEWDGQNWLQAAPAASPAARSRHAMWYNAGCGEVALTGGDIVGPPDPGGTWKWNGARWMAANDGIYLTSPVAAYDPASSRAVAFGGLSLAHGDSLVQEDTWTRCCDCDDEIAELDPQGNVVLPPTLDPDYQVTYVDVDQDFGLVSDVFPNFDTDADTWYENWPCLPAIGGERPDDADLTTIADSLAALGIFETPEAMADSLEIWESQILAFAQGQVDSLPMAPPVSPGTPYNPTQAYCPPAGFNYIFGGRDIVFVHGLKLEHIFDRVFGVPGAQVDWVPPSSFPGNTDNPEFYNPGGYYRHIAEVNWASHIQRFFTSRGIKNRYVIVSYPCNARLWVGIQALLTQISDAMQFETNVEDPTGLNNKAGFGTPSFVIVSHSTGGPVVDAALWAARFLPNLQADFIQKRCKAHVALSGAFTGSRYASAAVALSPALNVTGAALSWLCPLVNLVLQAFNNAPISCPPNFMGPIANSVLVDLSPSVTQALWGIPLANTGVPTVMANGGHPSIMFPLKNIFHPGFDDGVLCQNSVGANPEPHIFWPQGFQAGGGLFGVFKAYDLGMKQTTPKRALRFIMDQYVDPRLQPSTILIPDYLAASEILYLSTAGMLEPIGVTVPPFDPLFRINQHYSFMASTADHFSIRSADYYPDYKPTNNSGNPEANWEEIRTLLPWDLPALHAHNTPGPPYFNGDDQALLESGCTPGVNYSMMGRYVEFRIKIFGRKWIKRWWIWKRHYFRPPGSTNKHICDYVYSSILNCGDGIPKCDVSTAVSVPATVAFGGAAPNPFNAQTTITYSAPQRTHVVLRIYDVSGRLVRTLLDEVRPEGAGAVNWDGRNDTGCVVSSGVYFARLSVDGQTWVEPVSMVK